MSGFSFSFSFGNRGNQGQRGSRFQYSFGRNRTSRNNARTFDEHMRYLMESVLSGQEGAQHVFREMMETGRFRMHSNGVDVEKLKRTKIKESDVKNETACAVCLCEYERDEEVVVLPCKHMFHEACIKPWLKDHRTCPTCRKDVTDSSSSSDENLDEDGFSISDVMEAIRRSTSTPDTEEDTSSKVDENDDENISVDDENVSEEEKRQIERAIEMSLRDQQNQETRHQRQEQYGYVLNYAKSAFTGLLNTILPTDAQPSSAPCPVVVEEVEEDEKEKQDETEAYDLLQASDEDSDVPPGALEAPASVVLRVWLPNGYSVKTQTFTQNTSLIDVIRISLGHQYQDETEYVVWNKFPRYPFRDLSKSLGELNLTDLSQVAITKNGEEPTFSIRRTTT